MLELFRTFFFFLGHLLVAPLFYLLPLSASLPSFSCGVIGPCMSTLLPSYLNDANMVAMSLVELRAALLKAQQEPRVKTLVDALKAIVEHDRFFELSNLLLAIDILEVTFKLSSHEDEGVCLLARQILETAKTAVVLDLSSIGIVNACFSTDR